MRTIRIASLVASLSLSSGLSIEVCAQSVTALAPQVRPFVAVGDSVVALTHVTIIDGTGSAPRSGQTIVIRGTRIADVGPTERVRVPSGARVIELGGSTVIPGLVGMHEHLYYVSAGGRAAQMSFTGPRLYLASGVTTIRTAGGRSPYADINTKEAIDAGRIPGPRVHFTAPHVTGGNGGSGENMAEINTPEAARRFVDYWAQEGAEWIKAYTNIRRAELGAVIDEAHRRGIKVMGHLCAVTYREAAEMGIDNLEHGLFTSTDFDPQKTPDVCPENSIVRVTAASMHSDTATSVIRTMIAHGVAMTSTLAVFEMFFPNRPTNDERMLEAMSPEVRAAYLERRHAFDTQTHPALTQVNLENAMAFERAFVAAGGRLVAGVDPTGYGGALPGYGDQRNYELLIEAGFSAPEVIQIMSANGAKELGVFGELGTIRPGKIADLVVLDGDLESDPRVIRRVTTVYKDGVGYDSAKLIAAVKGRVGID